MVVLLDSMLSSPDAQIRSVQTNQSRLLYLQPEAGFYLVAVSDLLTHGKGEALTLRDSTENISAASASCFQIPAAY